MTKTEHIKIEIINPPTKEQAEQKLKELSEFLSKELSKPSKNHIPIIP